MTDGVAGGQQGRQGQEGRRGGGDDSRGARNSGGASRPRHDTGPDGPGPDPHLVLDVHQQGPWRKHGRERDGAGCSHPPVSVALHNAPEGRGDARGSGHRARADQGWGALRERSHGGRQCRAQRPSAERRPHHSHR
eukprot:359914-Rhodomonas_salina.2